MLIEIEQQKRVCILRCKGRFVAGPETDYMLTKLDDIKKLGCCRVVADFHDVISIGSTGVAFLVGLYTSVKCKPSGSFVLVGANPLVQQVLDLTGLTSVIPQAADVGSGIASLEKETSLGSTVLSNQEPANL